jgi:hypothetical protein
MSHPDEEHSDKGDSRYAPLIFTHKGLPDRKESVYRCYEPDKALSVETEVTKQ